jgi:serine protease AprX
MDSVLRDHLHKCDAQLQKRLAQAMGLDEEITVLIQRKIDDGQSTCDVLNKFVQDCGCRIIKELPIIGAVVIRLPVRILGQVASSHHVHRVHLDRTMHALLDVATPAIGVTPESSSRLTGKNVAIAILDTGIYAHPDLTVPQNRIVAFYDVIQGKTKPYDDNGHGTHVAGCAAGNGGASGGRYKGPAPEASLVGVKVLDGSGQGSISDIIDGVQWCVQHKDQWGIRILSLSLGGPASESYRDDPLCQALEKAWRSGLFVCVAAGNEGPGAGTISSPGIHPLLLTVGAVDDKRSVPLEDDKPAPFSSRGPTIDGLTKPDIVAPGVNIISLRSPGSTLDKTYPERRVGEQYVALSGTSMATPICAGAAALLYEAKPEASPDEIKTALLAGAKDLFHNPNTAGKGYVQAAGAVDALEAPETPAVSVGGEETHISVAFTPEIAGIIEREIAAAASEIAVEVPRITDLTIVTALANAARRGVHVRILLDAGHPENVETIHFLAEKGAEIRRFHIVPGQGGPLYTAFALFDQTKVLLGSGDWRHRDLYTSREHAVLTDSLQVVEQIAGVWQADWDSAISAAAGDARDGANEQLRAAGA